MRSNGVPTDCTSRLKSGEVLPAQLVILGVGVRPESTLAVAAGLEVGPRGGIHVDEHLRTSDPDIYAVGDAIEVTGYVTGDPSQIPLAGPANRQGRIAADHIFGRDSQLSRITGHGHRPGVRADRRTHRRERESPCAAPAGRSARCISIRAITPAIIPAPRPMAIKLLFEPDNGKVLGAQIVGEDGVNTRIDVLAVAIQAGMTVFDLEEVELAYAPQFGSAKDPINMAGFIAASVVKGDYRQVFVEDLGAPDSPAEKSFLLDVRTKKEFAADRIPGAVNVPLDDLRGRLGELPHDRPIRVYCQAGQRGYIATLMLQQDGFDAVNLAGGLRTYRMFHPH